MTSVNGRPHQRLLRQRCRISREGRPSQEWIARSTRDAGARFQRGGRAVMTGLWRMRPALAGAVAALGLGLLVSSNASAHDEDWDDDGGHGGSTGAWSTSTRTDTASSAMNTGRGTSTSNRNTGRGISERPFRRSVVAQSASPRSRQAACWGALRPPKSTPPAARSDRRRARRLARLVVRSRGGCVREFLGLAGWRRRAVRRRLWPTRLRYRRRDELDSGSEASRLGMDGRTGSAFGLSGPRGRNCPPRLDPNHETLCGGAGLQFRMGRGRLRSPQRQRRTLRGRTNQPHHQICPDSPCSARDMRGIPATATRSNSNAGDRHCLSMLPSHAARPDRGRA